MFDPPKLLSTLIVTLNFFLKLFFTIEAIIFYRLLTTSPFTFRVKLKKAILLLFSFKLFGGSSYGVQVQIFVYCYIECSRFAGQCEKKSYFFIL